MDTVLLLVFSLLVILFFVGFWPASRTWKWFHLFALSLVLIAATFYQINGAMLLKTRAIWGQLYVKTLKDLDALKTENDKYIQGTPATLKENPLSTHPGAKGALERLMVSRGRTWRNCTNQVVDAQKGTVMLRVPLSNGLTTGAAAPPGGIPGAPPVPGAGAPPPAEAAPAEGRSHGIAEHTILYAFAEGRIGDYLVPELYLGEYEVVATSADSVTLKPTLPLDKQQEQIVTGRTASWTVYERMPTDSSAAYDEYLKMFNLSRNDPAQANQVTEAMVGLIKKLADVSDENYQKAMQQYLRDGGEATQDDPSERVYAKVKFLKAYEADVDSPNKQVRLDSEFYDLNGLAILPGLRREGKAKFVQGDEAVIPTQLADELVNAGTVEKLATVFRRPLNDYKHHFHTIYHRVEYLTDRIAELTRQIADTDETQKKLQVQVDYRTGELMKLQKDLAKHREELAAVTEYEQQLTEEVAAIRGRANSLNQANIKLQEDIATAQVRMAEEITQKSQEAARVD